MPQLLITLYESLKKHDRVTVILVAVIAGGAWGFIALADEVLEGETLAFDQTVLLSMRNPSDADDPIGPRWVEEMARDITALGGIIILMLFTSLSVGFLWMTNQFRTGLFVGLAILMGSFASLALKSSFNRPRPDLVNHATEVYTKSFPSGHSAMSAMVFITLGALLARSQSNRAVKVYLMLVAMFLALIVGLSRVYLGVHWPTDVLAGWAFGISWASTSWLILRYVEKKSLVEDHTA